MKKDDLNYNYIEKNKNGFYQKNLSFLKKRNESGLIKKIEEVNFPQDIEIVKTKTGFPTLRIKKESGQSILLHSRYDPVKEARNFLAGYDLDNTDFLIVLGFGLGYHVEEIIKSYSKIKLILVVEPHPYLFKFALSIMDLSSILSSPKIRLILEDDPVKIKEKILPLGEIFLTGKISIVVHYPSSYLLGDKFVEIKKSISDAILWSRANLGTNIAKGDIFQKNILANLPQIINNPGIKNLFDKFKDKPVICVAAGPSLDKNIHLLKEAKDKALIICVDAALRTMLKHKIKPDIVVSIDYGIGARNLFDGIMEQTEDLFLAADPEVCPDVFSDFRGKKFIINIPKPLVGWLSNFMEDKGFLEKGSSVAHAAFFLAKAVGGDPIIFVGQDLSYPEGITHADGAIPRKKITIGINEKTGEKYLLIKTKDGKWIGQDLIMVKDIYGKDVPTSGDMYSYLVYFEKLIASTKAKCIDATEGGAKIRGTEVMSLREVIDRYCSEPIGVREILEEAAKNKEKVNLGKLKEEIQKVIKHLMELHFYAGRGEEVIKKLLKEIKREKPNRQKMEELTRESNDIANKITRRKTYIRAFLEQNMYSHLYLVRRKDNLILSGLKGKKRLITQIEKVGIFYNGTKKAAIKLINDFRSSLDKLDSTV